MTHVLDRPTTEVDVRTQTEVRPKPFTLDREVQQLPPVTEPPGRFRWLGWLLGIAAVAAIVWLVVGEITADDSPVASPTYVVTEGAITSDPKVRTPVVTPEMANESIRTGIPGSATLTDVVTFSNTPAESLENATVNPMIFWAVPPTYATVMEEATVWPPIYEAAAIQPNVTVTPKSAYPGVYWRHDQVLEESSLLTTVSATTATTATTSVLPGAYWRYDLVLEERPLFPAGLDLTFGMWPAMNAEPATLTQVSMADLGIPDWPPSTLVPVASAVVHGGHMNIML